MQKFNIPWLKITQHSADVSIQKRADLTDLFDTSIGKPSLVLLIGTAVENLATQAFYKSCQRHRGPGEIYLRYRAKPRSVVGAREFLLVSGPVDIPVTAEKDPATSASVDWLARDPFHALPAVYSRVFGPFADTVCFSVSDFGGVPRLAQFIAAWLRQACPSPCLVRPKLVVFVDEPSTGPAWAAGWAQRFLSQLREITSISVEKSFSGVSVHSWDRGARVRNACRIATFRDALPVGSHDDRPGENPRPPGFNTHQLSFLLEESYKSFLRQQNFDPIVSSRLLNPVSAHAARNVRSFLRALPDAQTVREFALPVIASCFLLDGFPPEMCRFDPKMVYETLYQPVWEKAAKGARLSASIIGMLEHQFLEIHDADSTVPYAARHRQLMGSAPARWKTVRDDNICLMCLMAAPEYSIPCGHRFCDSDIRRYGAPRGPSTFYVDACWLCSQKAGLVFRLKPRTKGINVLGIDGGGIRGIVPLETLSSAEQRLKPYLPGFPIQDLFDLAIGTSSGGLIVLAIMLQGIRVAKCIQVFRALAGKAFLSRFGRSESIISRALNLLVTLFRDCKYPSRNIENALKEQFGRDATMFDHSPAAARGAKVGITMTGVPGGEYMISNYSGLGSREFRRGYQHVLSDGDPQNRIRGTGYIRRSVVRSPVFAVPIGQAANHDRIKVLLAILYKR
ncbi:hypothetical protein F5Y16DRAFT_420638 [Xylariaceae sp. FL0255]|nr:hypothetical protein F5Y16DRAFT_420638 [Xylariaceae sp. FL0255]